VAKKTIDENSANLHIASSLGDWNPDKSQKELGLYGKGLGASGNPTDPN